MAQIGSLKILYEDNHCVAVYKPAGILTQGDKNKNENLMDAVKKYLKKKYAKPGNVFLGLVHRLDRNVSGIILFAKNSKSAAKLSKQFSEHAIRKIYEAEVLGLFKPKSGTLKNYLEKNTERMRADVYDAPGDKRQFAELAYETLREKNTTSVLKIELKTGRFHQIRAQLSAAGHSIVGDVKYGAPAKLKNHAVALKAVELEFESPSTKKKVRVRA